MSEPVKGTVPGKNGGTLMAPWQKGVSQNPGGMPKGTKVVKKRLRRELVRYLRANPHVIAEIAASLAEEARTRPETIIEREGKASTTTIKGQGWAQAQKLVWERLDGLLTQQSDVNVNMRFEKRVHDDEDDGNDSP